MSRRASLLSRIAVALAAAGDIPSALQTAALVRDGFWTLFALDRIAVAQAERGEVEGAFQTVGVMPPGDSRGPTTLGQIAAVQFKAGDLTGARRTLLQALDATGTIRNSTMRCQALSAIAREQAQVGDVHTALRIVAEMAVENFPPVALAGC